MSNVLTGAPWLCAMARVFDKAGAPLYVVGGGVRNPLMGLPISDVDVCGPTLPQEICRLCEGTEVRAKIRTLQMGTVELYVVDENGVEQMAEYTAWREERYTGGHTPSEVRFTTDIRVDAARRDFSSNALYQRVHDGWAEAVIDPTGGLSHIREGILHTTTENPDGILANDGQRLLRAARFQAELGLTPSPAMRESLHRNIGLLRDISLERMRDELAKIVMADTRYPGLSHSAAGLETLRQMGAWPILFPDAPYDEAAVMALCRFPETIEKRLALLLRHAPAKEALLRLRFPNRVADLAQSCATAYREPDADLRKLAGLGMDALKTAQSMRRALGDPAREDVLQRLQGKPLSLKDLAVSGRDLLALGVEPRAIGKTLDTLWELTLSGRVPNEKTSLLATLRP